MGLTQSRPSWFKAHDDRIHARAEPLDVTAHQRHLRQLSRQVHFLLVSLRDLLEKPTLTREAIYRWLKALEESGLSTYFGPGELPLVPCDPLTMTQTQWRTHLNNEGECLARLYEKVETEYFRDEHATGQSRAKAAEEGTSGTLPKPKSKATAKNPVEALLEPEGEEILRTARSQKTVDDKMRSICGVDQRYLEWNSHRWSELLGVSDAAIRKSAFWKFDRKRAMEASRSLRKGD